MQRARLWLESVEDLVSADVGRVVQTSKSDLMARGVAFDLLQMAKQVGPQCEAAEYEDLLGEENLTLDRIVADDRRSHQALWSRHSGTLNESTNVGVKTGGSRVGVPNCASRPDGNRRQGTRCFTQVRALLMEVKPYVLLD